MKFIASYYNKETGKATVIMQHLSKKFVGEAFLNPEEKEKGSEFAGCKYAEIRATIKALKYDREQYNKGYTNGYTDGYTDGYVKAIEELKDKLCKLKEGINND